MGLNDSIVPMGLPNDLGGFPPSTHWNSNSRQLGGSTAALRSFVVANIVDENQWEIDRITRYSLFMKFYQGYHFRQFNDSLLAFNYVRAFIDKVSMFLLGSEAFSFRVRNLYTTQVEQETEKLAEELVMYHWAKSGKIQLAYDLLQAGSVFGDAWAGVSWEDGEEDRYVKISVFDSRQCFVTFENGNFDKMESFIVRQPLDQKSLRQDGSTATYKLYVKKYTKTTVEEWYQKDLALEEGRTRKYEHKTDKNPYGFIPVVHIKNKPNSVGYYGMSDANDILKINKVYNEMQQQLKSIVDYHVSPITVVQGATARNLKRGLGEIWSGLPAEATVSNLGLDVDMSAATNFIKELKVAMHELSDVPENALGKIQAISNTSAAALQITYHPLMQQANVKAMTYGEGITKLNTMILRILKIEDPKNKRLTELLRKEPNFLAEMCIEPVFAYGFPKDRLDELNKAQMELQMKLGSRREIMERMGKQNIPELLLEIDEDEIHSVLLAAQAEALALAQTQGSVEESSTGGESAQESTPMETQTEPELVE